MATSMAESPPSSLVAFPNAKINLGLQIREKRADGYHAINSVFIPIPWCDTLEIATPAHRTTGCELHLGGHPIQGTVTDNLVHQAYELLDGQFQLPPADFHLIKAIPSGAGLGGGSADGTFTLRLLNEHFGLGLQATQLEELAESLGSDCPFFVRNAPANVTGRGELISPISLELDGWHVALIHPGIHVPTSTAFQWVTPKKDRPGLAQWNGSSPLDWSGKILNDFTRPVGQRHPEIHQALTLLHAAGATFADMSGSGSAVFGFFPTSPPEDLFKNCPNHWRTWSGSARV